MTAVLLLIGAYLLGSIPTGYWLGRYWKGIDIRTMGSGNLGATNVFRVLGKTPGFLTLVIDMAKGFLPVFLAHTYFPGNYLLAMGAAIASIAGHATSPFVGFHGGKGVATSGGAYLALMPIPSVISLTTFAITFAITRIVSMSSLVATFAMCVAAVFYSPSHLLTGMTFVIAAFLFWSHRSNLKRLREGKETPLSVGKTA